MNYCQFCDFGPLERHFWLSHTIILSLRLNKNITGTMECLKCIIKCLYQIVFRFGQFLDFKLTYLLNYCQFCDFGPQLGIFWLWQGIILSLRLNKKITDTMECIKCIIKCLYHLVFKFDQFLDFKLAYLMNYCQFFDFGPTEGHFLALAGYYSLFEAK
jgi:hypothetical protein